MTFSTGETHNGSTVKWRQQLSDRLTATLCFLRASLSFIHKDVLLLNETLSSHRADEHLISWFVFLFFFSASGCSCTSLRQYDYCKQESSSSSSSSSLGRPPRRSACCQPLPRIWMEICWTERSRWKLFLPKQQQQKKRLEKIFFLMMASCGRRERNGKITLWYGGLESPTSCNLKDTHAKIYRIQDLQENRRCRTETGERFKSYSNNSYGDSSGNSSRWRTDASGSWIITW